MKDISVKTISTMLPMALNKRIKNELEVSIFDDLDELVKIAILYFKEKNGEDIKQFIQPYIMMGEMKKYLIEEKKFPKIKYQIFEIPYKDIIKIEENRGNQSEYRKSLPTYSICYGHNSFKAPCIYIEKFDFPKELKVWLKRVVDTYDWIEGEFLEDTQW